MKGLKISVYSQYNNILKSILKDIDFDNFIFDTGMYESYEVNMPDNWIYLSDLETIPSHLIKKRVLEDEDRIIRPEFLELYIRPAAYKYFDVNSYEDFINSDYQMIILVIDARNIEIVTKNQSWLKKIVDNIDSMILDNIDLNFKLINEIKPSALLKCYRDRNEKGII